MASLPPELLSLLLGNDLPGIAPRPVPPPYIPHNPMAGPDWTPQVPPNLSFPPQAPPNEGFFSRFAQTFADNPTNFQNQPGQSQLLQFLQSAANSGSQSYAARRQRELANSPADAANRLALARISNANLKTANEISDKRVKYLLEKKGGQSDKPLTLSPGEMVFDPKTGRPVFTAPFKPEAPNKPRGPIALSPGQVLFDPETGKPIYTAPPKEAKGAKGGGQNAEYSLTTADQTIAAAQRALGHVNGFTSGMGSITSLIPGSPAANLKAELTALAANIAFKSLQQMRDASKTGGALGQVSDKEGELLSSVMGSLRQDQSPENLKKTLRTIISSTQRFRNALAAAQKEAGGDWFDENAPGGQ